MRLLWDVSLRHMSIPTVCNIVLQCVGELVQNPDTHGALLGVACKLVLEVGTRGPRVASTQGHAVACVGHMLRVATRVNQAIIVGGTLGYVQQVCREFGQAPEVQVPGDAYLIRAATMAR